MLVDLIDDRVTDIDEDDGGELEEDEEEGEDTVDGQEAGGLPLGPTEAGEGDEEGDGSHSYEGVVEVRVGGHLVQGLLQPRHLPDGLGVVAKDLLGRLLRCASVHNQPDSSGHQQEAKQGEEEVGQEEGHT